MKKVLVRTSFVTSVEVSDIATEEEIMVKAKIKLIEQIVNEFEENVEEIVPDTELTVIEDNTPKGESECECIVTVTIIDENNNHQNLVVEHNGESDCWNDVEVNGKMYAVNTYDGTEFGDLKNHKLGIAVEQLTEVDGFWSSDNAKEIKVFGYKIERK